MTAHRRLHLVVPCYNEAARLSAEAFLGFVHSSPGTVVLFVDDGSTDGTAGLLTRLAESAGACVQVLVLPGNVGKAEAVRQGVLAALRDGASYVGYWDADLSTPLDAVTGFMSVFEEHKHVDVVMGARVQLLGRRVQRRPIRHYVGRVFATAASMILGVPVYDTQCGAKIFRVGKETSDAFASGFESRWAFDVEILARYIGAVGGREAAVRIVEVPLDAWHDVPGSKLNVWHGVEAFVDLARIGVRWRLRRRRAS